MKTHFRGRQGRLVFGAVVIVAAATVGFAVGDALATPGKVAATITGRSAGTPDFQRNWTLAAGKTFEIEGVNGAIRATGTTGRTVEVTARKHARRSNPDEVTIEVLEHPEGITLCVRYPDRGGERNTCEPGGRSHVHVDDNDVAVDFEVRVPAGVRFVARTVNGSVAATDLDADTEARTVNGSVTIETRGAAEAETVNGALRARVGRLAARGSIVFRTVNGSVVIELPASVAAQVRAKTVHGGIASDFPLSILRIEHGLVGERLEGTLGKGGPELEIETVNGSIQLRKIDRAASI